MEGKTTNFIEKSTKVRAWTEEELNFIKVNYKRMTASEISKKLNRPLQSVYGKVKVMGLRKLSPYKYKNKKVGVPKRVTEETLIEKKVNTAPIKTDSKSTSKSNSTLLILSFLASITSLILACVSITISLVHP